MNENQRVQCARLIYQYAKTHTMPTGWQDWVTNWIRYGGQKAVQMHPLHEPDRFLLLAHDSHHDVIVLQGDGQEHHITTRGIVRNR